MLVARNIAQIREQLNTERDLGKSIALVATMGALHEGHLSLITQAKKFAEIVVVSIFVNKSQFNNPQDFHKYPRQEDADLTLLEKSETTHVFLPDNDEIFNENFSFKLNETSLTNCLCGTSRPGHFDGVALIITKLFNIIRPNFAAFGQKDFQQVAIINKLVQDFNFDVKIIPCPTAREKNGLASSSRNKRLTSTATNKAANIFKTLSQIKTQVKESPQEVTSILQKNRDWLLNNGFEKIDYLEIRQDDDLKLVKVFDSTKASRIFIALYLDEVRLIDNLSLQ